jgi:hypothetical protein
VIATVKSCILVGIDAELVDVEAATYRDVAPTADLVPHVM